MDWANTHTHSSPTIWRGRHSVNVSLILSFEHFPDLNPWLIRLRRRYDCRGNEHQQAGVPTLQSLLRPRAERVPVSRNKHDLGACGILLSFLGFPYRRWRSMDDLFHLLCRRLDGLLY